MSGWGHSLIIIACREVNCPNHSGNISRPLHCINFSNLRALRFFMLSVKDVTLQQSRMPKICRELNSPSHTGSASRSFNDLKNSSVREVKHRMTSGNVLNPPTKVTPSTSRVGKYLSLSHTSWEKLQHFTVIVEGWMEDESFPNSRSGKIVSYHYSTAKRNVKPIENRKC